MDDGLDPARRSLKSLGLALCGLASASLAASLVLGDPAAWILAPWVLGGAAIVFGLRVWHIDAKPKPRWRGTATTAVAMGLLVVVRQAALLMG